MPVTLPHGENGEVQICQQHASAQMGAEPIEAKVQIGPFLLSFVMKSSKNYQQPQMPVSLQTLLLSTARLVWG